MCVAVQLEQGLKCGRLPIGGKVQVQLYASVRIPGIVGLWDLGHQLRVKPHIVVFSVEAVRACEKRARKPIPNQVSLYLGSRSKIDGDAPRPVPKPSKHAAHHVTLRVGLE